MYDSANQLIRENNQAGNYTHTWTYDNAGNILTRKEYAYTTVESLDNVTPDKTVAYAYNDEIWGDLLTTYDNQGITYDGIGNPVNDGTWIYEWQRGRQLKAMSEIGGDTVWTYTYDSNGMRTGRTDGTTTYSYVYNGSQLVQMTVGTNALRFTYDAAGTPLSVNYNGTTYYYVTNIQGDVVAIVNASGVEQVRYTYSAWGQLLATEGTMATTLGTHNPLRYRGYAYDTETELYYVSSRYYNSVWNRFLNADILISTGQGMLGNNMFAYCRNNPVCRKDVSGTTDEATPDDGTDLLDEEKTFEGGRVGNNSSNGVIGGSGHSTSDGSNASNGTTALQPYYPPNNGVVGKEQKVTLQPGTLVQRTGDLGGKYIAPAGTPKSMLSLPYDKAGQPTIILEVRQPVIVSAGRVAPWFGQIGGGIQYQLDFPLIYYVNANVMRIIA